MEEEIWKRIDNTSYFVSNLGNIKTEDRHIEQDNGRGTIYQRLIKGTDINTIINPSGYHTFNIKSKGNSKTTFVHKEVAKAFIENPHNKDEVNHIDHDKNNNNLYNLEWATRQENMKACSLFYESIGIFKNSRFKKKYCDCGKEMARKSKSCRDCSNKLKVKSVIVDKESLYNLLKTESFTSVGNMFNVSDNAIRKWCIKYNIPSKSSYYRKYK